ncbi:hypothetical protein NOU13_32350 [Rhodococcus erythropolis]|uniref:hypothetical protein n=1 Tax=Rhodococcus erythropolis TaxID=1833 RepID=UPI0021095786|nr:hypothetical protein [Rhodococcus erythropolis]MCQ4129199.1 hypothetical protein [Rhodococcus erythropolis]
MNLSLDAPVLGTPAALGAVEGGDTVGAAVVRRGRLFTSLDELCAPHTVLS